MAYDKFITMKKGIYQLLLAIIAAGITGGIGFIHQLPPEQSSGIFIIVLALLKMAENYMKHMND